MKSKRLYLELQVAIENALTIPPCQVTDPQLWFGSKDSNTMDYNKAKRFCKECPVQRECLDYAVDAAEAHGIWGGTTVAQRDRIISARNRIRKQSGRLA
jgi:hypothetical protein